MQDSSNCLHLILAWKRVIRDSGRPGFSGEAPSGKLVLLQIQWAELDRHLPIERGIPGKKGFSHPPFFKHGLDSVLADRLSNQDSTSPDRNAVYRLDISFATDGWQPEKGLSARVRLPESGEDPSHSCRSDL